MKFTALGVNSAFAVGKTVVANIDGKDQKVYIPKGNSNFMMEFDQGKEEPYRLIYDAGMDIRNSLMYAAGLTVGKIDGVYISHPHADHIGGIEGIALSIFFNPFWRPQKTEWLKAQGDLNIMNLLMKDETVVFPENCKPELFAHRDVLREVWKATAPGLKTLQGVRNVSLETYFTLRPMTTNVSKKIKDGNREWSFYTIESTHVMSGTESMPTFGLMWECSDGQRIYMPADTMLMMPPAMETFYTKADVIYQDTETGPRSGVHSHIDDIEKVKPEIKKKLYLYHYNEEPAVDESQYKGILRTGDVHEY